MKYFLFCVFLFFSVLVNAESLKNKTFGDVIVSEITSIYDGDTFRVNIAEWPEIMGYRIGIRVNGIDTPEKRGKCKLEKQLAQSAKEFTVNMLRSAKKIELRNIKRGKYFRIVADVFADGLSLSETLIKANHAVKYDGGTKGKDWCKK
jgi:micrococcal nuclease